MDLSTPFHRYMGVVSGAYSLTGLSWLAVPSKIMPLMFSKHRTHFFNDDVVRLIGHLQGYCLISHVLSAYCWNRVLFLTIALFAYAATSADNIRAQTNTLRAVVLASLFQLAYYSFGYFVKDTLTLSGFVVPTIVHIALILSAMITSARQSRASVHKND